MVSTWPATFSGRSWGHGLQADRKAGGSGPGGPGYSMVWEVLNASTSASTSASKRHLWEQNHRKRKKPAGGSLVSGCTAGAAGPTQDPGTSLAQATWASQTRTSNSQTPLLLAARRDRAWELEDPVTSSKLEGDMLPVGSVVPNQPGWGPASPH